MSTATQITIYLKESDRWEDILRMPRKENVAGEGAFHAVGGFIGRNRVRTASLVDAGGELPVMVIFTDLEEHVGRVLPRLRFIP